MNSTSSSSSSSKKRISLSASQKKELCKRAKNNPSLTQDDLAKDFKIGRSTVSMILSESNKWLSIDETLTTSQFKKNRQANWPQLEEALALWFDQAIKHNLTISGDILKTKAQALAKITNINDFKGSDGWLSRFKHRHHIYSVTKQGESASAPLELLPQYREELQEILKNYDPSDIYNCDETALFWQLEPSKTLAHGETSGTKQSKERVSIMLSCNSKGEKLKPLLIHKYENPRALKGIDKIKLPVYYYWNKKAWMQVSIFQHWIKKVNEQMKKEKKKIIMLLDNASSHVGEDLDLSNVKLHFLPANTTAHLQPLDAGIIWSFKCHYKKLLCQNRIEMYDLYKITENKESISKLTIYDAIKFISKAWENVKGETIIHSWDKVGILPKDDLHDYVNYEAGEDGIELELQSIINEYYRESQTVEDTLTTNAIVKMKQCSH
jgi:DNA-binding XRE family transcriptional regulator